MILAAGLGTRLKPFTEKHPKALAMVNGKTLLEHNIVYLQQFGIRDVVVNVHHFATQIEEALQQNNGFGSRFQISDERHEVLETGGGLLHAFPLLGEENFVVMNVDILTNFNMAAMIDSHGKKNNPVATLAVMKRSSSRQLLFDKDFSLSGWRNKISNEEKISRATNSQEFAFSGIQIISPHFFSLNKMKGKFSVIDAYLDIAKANIIKGFDHTGDLLLDVGKSESLALAEQLFT